MACPKFVDRKKSFHVVAIALGILVLCITIFPLTFWELTSRNNQVEKNYNVFTTIFSVGTTTKATSSKMVLFLRDTTIPETRYERKTESSKVGTTAKAASSNMISLLTDSTMPATSHERKTGSSKVGTTTKAASSKTISLLRDTTMPATSYEPKTESSKMTIIPIGTNVEKRLDDMVCSHINISSNLAMQEQYPGLFGAYERVGLVNGRMMYMNPKTWSEIFYSNSIYHRNYYDDHTETEEYQTKWTVKFEDYLKFYRAFDINCYDIVTTNSNCNPEWRFCNYTALDRPKLKMDCIIIEAIKFQCINDSTDVKPIQDNQEKCQELELSSIDGIAKTVPEIMGIYSLEDYLYNDMVVYVHKDNGFNLRYTNNSIDMLNQSLTGVWDIHNDTDLLSDNLFCEDTDLSMDGKCKFGWSYPINNHTMRLDYTASIICIKPSPVVTNIPTGVICQTFQLMSATAFEVEMLTYSLGQYIITESTNNGMVVYRHRHYSLFFYSMVSTFVEGGIYWAIGSEVGSESGRVFNPYCWNFENPANGNCTYGWFYYNVESQTWNYDINMRIQCTNYLPNSII